ncbi:MAG: CBS domain-containing protein [Deltaproteobacteria bacterium]|nr:CBS domain-containing protein [Deltaproteobacteria bacterium]
MQARRVMTVKVTAVPPEYPLDAAARLMQKLRVRHLPVVLAGKLCGIVSDRDVLLRTTLHADGRREVSRAAVGEAMTTCPIAANPTTSVSTLATLMLENRFDALPVVTPDETLIGLVTSTDLLELLRHPDRLTDELPFDFELLPAPAAAAGLPA